MTSSAISLLTTVAAPAPQKTASDQATLSSKKDAQTFSETLQKADKVQGVKASATSGTDSKVDKSKTPQENKAAGTIDQPGTSEGTVSTESKVSEPKNPLTSEVVQEEELTPPPANIKPAPAVSTKPGNSEASVKPVKDEEAIEIPDVPIAPVVVAPAPVTDPASILTQQVSSQAASVEGKDSEAGSDNVLGTSILASINMGKSLDKSATGQKLADTVSRSAPGHVTTPKYGATPDLGDSATLTPAQANKAAQAPTDAVASVSTPVVQKPVESSQIKASIENVVDGKSADSQPRSDSLSSANPIAASAQASGPQGSSTTAQAVTLQTPVSNPEWAKSLGQQLVNFHLKGDQNVQLHLNPANLGPMSITLNVNEHLQATAHFSSHSGQVRSALEQGIGQLREAMAQQGISLGETSVGEQRQQSFSQSDQGQQSRGNIQQLPGMTLVADESTTKPAVSAASAGEISTYA